MTEAIKYDTGKPEMMLFPPKALWGITEALTYGVGKYCDYNYKLGKGLNWSRPFNATMRHLTQWNFGEDIDTESGLNHLKHAGASIAMLIDLVESKIGKDDRFDQERRD